jgi:hypothetical protein
MAERSRESKNTQAPDEALSPPDRATVNASHWALGSLAVSMISLIVSFYSAYLTGQQNSNAQQQELVTLVTDIAQGQQGSSTVNVNGISVELTQLGEAEEADNIINSIPSHVSSVERYIVGMGLEAGKDYQPALKLVMEAAMEGSDPRTAADAWRAAAEIKYKLGSDSQAESDIYLAKRSFDKPDVLKFDKENDIAYTDLFDVYYQAPINCSAAINEWHEAAGLIKENKNLLSGPNATATEKNAGNALANTCHVPLAVLEKEIPFQVDLPQPG